MIDAVDHVGLSVANLDRSIEFYRNLLGAGTVKQGAFGGYEYSTIMRLPEAHGRSAMVTAPGARIELFEFAHPLPAAGDANRSLCDPHFLCLSVPAETIEDAVAGVGRDPDGNLYELRLPGERGYLIALSISNIDRSIVFYRDLLRMELTTPKSAFDAKMGAMLLGSPESGWRASLRAANLQLELFECSSARRPNAERPVCDHGITHFCIKVSRLAEEYARLESAGVRFHCSPLEFFGRATATYGRDPDGNVFEMLQPVQKQYVENLSMHF